MTIMGNNKNELMHLAKLNLDKKLYDNDIELYSFGRIIRSWGFYPSFFPLYITSQHGVCLWDHPQSHELNSPYSIMLVFSKRMQKSWKKLSNKQCHVLKNPFIIYRHKSKIKKSRDAKGTLFFFGHSADGIDINIDTNRLIRQLKRLPNIYHPISICFYFSDILKGYHKRFLDNRFKCYTVGNYNDPKFVERFYAILNKHQYTMSNVLGSYAFYSIEMNIPFSLYGDRPQYINKSDTNFPRGKYDFTRSHKYLKETTKLFERINTKITNRQKAIVESELGVHDSISRLHLSAILYKSYLYNLIKKILEKTINFFKKIKVYYFYHLLNNYLYLLLNNLSNDNKIYTHMTVEEKIAMHNILKKQQKKLVCVEIGSFIGGSSCFIANAISDNSRLFCVDTWKNDAMIYTDKDTEVKRDTFDEFKNNIEGYKYKIVTIRSWSSRAINTLKRKIKHIDFLFIDADHHYESVKSDWFNYYPLLKKGSIVAFHDTGWAEGVKRVISEYVIYKSRLILKLPNMQFYQIII